MDAQANRFAADLEDKQEEGALDSGGFVLQRLRPRHRDVCALLAQGLKNTEVASVTGYTPEYISALMRQPLCIAYIQTLNESEGQRLEAMFGKAVSVIGEAMDAGNIGEKLKAVRLHGELTKRIGSKDLSPPSSEDSNERLVRLANRLVGLLETAKTGSVINGTCETVQGSSQLRQHAMLGQGSADEAYGDERED